jgi:hypothetical protein
MQTLAPNTVLVTTLDIQSMRKVWPCSGLPYDGYCLSFEFDSHGNLCDVNWYTDEGIDATEPEGIDGACMVALSEDAQKFLESHAEVL